MSARDVMADKLKAGGHKLDGLSMADGLLRTLTNAGYVILSPDEVRGIRDEALEEAAKVADERAASRERLYSENGASINASKAIEAEEIAAAIRSLKGCRDAQ